MDRKGKCFSCILSLILITGVCISGIAYGNEFWVGLGTNLHNQERDLYISSSPGATGNVQNFDGSFNVPFTVLPGGTVIITVPSSLAPQYAGGVISNLGLRISADNQVIAYLMDANHPTATNDLAVLFPTTGIGTEYLVMAYGSNIEYSQMVIAATQDGTNVTITPKVTTTDGKTAGTPFTVTLNAFQTVQYLSSAPADLTGTIVSSDKPVSVFGGHTCAYVPGGTAACDILYEQIPPVSTWGMEFGMCPTNRPVCPGDVLRVLASADGTAVTVNINGSTSTHDLNRGEYFTIEGAGGWMNGPTHVTSNHPVLVGQYMVGGTLCGSWGDPAFLLVPPVNQWASGYIFNTPLDYDLDYISVTIQATQQNSFVLDGVPVGEVTFSPIPETTLVCGAIPVADGPHQIAAGSPFLLQIYGYDDYWASYASVGGQIASGGGGSLHAPKTGEIVMFEDGGRRMHFMTTYQDDLGNGHITEAQLKITREEDGEVILAYDVEENLLKMEDTYLGVTRSRGQCMPGQLKTLRGKLLTLNCQKTNVVASENTLKVQWLVKAKKTFAGLKDLLLWVKDKDAATDGYNEAGTWFSE